MNVILSKNEMVYSMRFTYAEPFFFHPEAVSQKWQIIPEST